MVSEGWPAGDGARSGNPQDVGARPRAWHNMLTKLKRFADIGYCITGVAAYTVTPCAGR